MASRSFCTARFMNQSRHTDGTSTTSNRSSVNPPPPGRLTLNVKFLRKLLFTSL